MKIPILLAGFFLFSCGGSLSSEQRKKIRDNMEAKSIKKISDAELTEAALEYGRAIARIVEQSQRSDKKFLDSLGNAYDTQIMYMKPSDSELRSIEKQIIDAYTSGSSSVNLSDNVQRTGNDTLLYTKPLLRERPDGSVEFTKALGLRIHKKAVILSIKN